jgi:hypothetical protein
VASGDDREIKNWNNARIVLDRRILPGHFALGEGFKQFFVAPAGRSLRDQLTC